jgi:hypothetical protein
MRERFGAMSRLARWVLTFTAAGMLSLVAFVAALLWLPAIGSPSGDALRYSLMRQAGGSMALGDSYDCERPAPEIRICEVPDVSNSGFGRYRVRMEGKRCWHARKMSGNRWEEGSPPLKLRVSGCVEFRDQVRLFERASS